VRGPIEVSGAARKGGAIRAGDVSWGVILWGRKDGQGGEYLWVGVCFGVLEKVGLGWTAGRRLRVVGDTCSTAHRTG
jgi:hypothetical protein